MPQAKTSAVNDSRFELKIWGSRGSLPVAAPCFTQFGGNTMCIELRCGDHVLIFDAGSGFPMAGRALLEEGCQKIDVFFTHGHYDHVIGLPFFLPFYMCDGTTRLWSGHQGRGLTTREMIADFMRQPFFPVGPEVFRANVDTVDFQPGDVLTPAQGVVMRTASLNHPGGAVGYRIEYGGRVVAMVFDTEHTPGTLDPAALGLMQGADLCFYDANFTDAEFESYRNFGHSTWEQGLRLAQKAGAARIGFVHHATYRTDADLLLLEHQAQKEFPGAFFARDFQKITL